MIPASNHSSMNPITNPALPSKSTTKPHAKVPYGCVLNTSRAADSNLFPGNPVPVLDNCFGEEMFLISNLIPAVQFETVSSHPDIVTWEKRLRPTLICLREKKRSWKPQTYLTFEDEPK